MSSRLPSSGDFPTPRSEDLRAIITDANASETLVKVADDLGKVLAKPLATSQIRSIFGEVLRIKADWLEGSDPKRKARARRALVLLKPKMAYRAEKERARGRGVKDLVSVLMPAINLVGEKPVREGDTQDDNFRRFFEFFEAILAYHKAYGGN